MYLRVLRRVILTTILEYYTEGDKFKAWLYFITALGTSLRLTARFRPGFSYEYGVPLLTRGIVRKEEMAGREFPKIKRPRSGARISTCFPIPWARIRL